MYLLVAITGYLSYGDAVNGNIVSMYPNSISANIGRTAIVVLILFSYPLQAHPCRASLDKIIVSAGRAMHLLNEKLPVSRTVSRHSSAVNLRGIRQETEAVEEHISDLRWTLLTTFILIATYLVAFMVSSLEVVLSYVGATGSTAISFILPGLFYWRITSDSDEYVSVASDEQEDDTVEHETGATWVQSDRRKRYTRYGAAALGIYGVVFMIVCLTLNIVGSVSAH